jgi:hypothetical protein
MKYYFYNRIIHDDINNCVYYYTDIDKKWTNKTDNKGLRLLLICCKEAQRMLKINKGDISNKKYNKIIKTGKAIYKEKSSLNSGGPTWSYDEYSNVGLLYWYLLVKSLQRFTENWNLINRFDNITPHIEIKNNYNVFSIGGGPGFECIALDEYYKDKNIKLNFFICDNNETWRKYLKYKFILFDFMNDDMKPA